MVSKRKDQGLRIAYGFAIQAGSSTGHKDPGSLGIQAVRESGASLLAHGDSAKRTRLLSTSGNADLGTIEETLWTPKREQHEASDCARADLFNFLGRPVMQSRMGL